MGRTTGLLRHLAKPAVRQANRQIAWPTLAPPRIRIAGLYSKNHTVLFSSYILKIHEITHLRQAGKRRVPVFSLAKISYILYVQKRKGVKKEMDNYTGNYCTWNHWILYVFWQQMG